jgi:hypothetical protein
LERRIASCGLSPQPNGEFLANKSKKNQIKPRKKAWISLDSFGRFGAFQWVTANPNKKVLFACGSRLRLCLSLPGAHSERSFRSAESIQRILDLAKILSPVIDFESRILRIINLLLDKSKAQR